MPPPWRDPLVRGDVVEGLTLVARGGLRGVSHTGGGPLSGSTDTSDEDRDIDMRTVAWKIILCGVLRKMSLGVGG